MNKINHLPVGPSIPQYDADLLQCTSNIVSAYLNKNQTDLRQLPQVMETVYSILAALGESKMQASVPLPMRRSQSERPSVMHWDAVEKSITPEYIVCLEDGVRLKTLKRYLFRKYRLTPEQYRSKWGLPPDYPMVAPNYAAKRSSLAKQMGLGRKKKSHSPGKSVRKRSVRSATRSSL